jgi:hypothetical protein
VIKPRKQQWAVNAYIEERSEMEMHLVFNADYPLKREANLMLRKAVAA